MSSYIKPKCFILLCFKVYECTSELQNVQMVFNVFPKKIIVMGVSIVTTILMSQQQIHVKVIQKSDVEDTCEGNK